MNAANTRRRLVCHANFPATREFCPVCMLREALGEGGKSQEPSQERSPREVKLKRRLHRLAHYALVVGKDGKPVELGRGAMGVTFKALDINLGCPVTLKVISERYLSDESARLRFAREARAAASVRHPNVASVSSTWVELGTVTSTRWSL
jgi:hypothetical protein